MGAYQALKELVDYKEKTKQDIIYDNYYFKCGEIMLNQQEYDMEDSEKNLLYSLYSLYGTNLHRGMLGDSSRDSRGVEFQRDFYTKLFIYDKIYQIEKENGIDDGISAILYNDYVVELNTTTNIDGEQTPKRAMDMFQDFAKKELKDDEDFLRVINIFCNSQIEMTFLSNNVIQISVFQLKKEKGKN